MHIMAKRLIETDILSSGMLDKFTAVLIADSSSWDIPEGMKWIFPGSGGAASEANCKIQFCYDYKTGEPKILEETKGKLPDQKYARILPSIAKKGALFIFDLGYWAFDVLNNITLKNAFFLCRLNTQVNLWADEDGKFVKVNLSEWLGKQMFSAVETNVLLKNKHSVALPIRLVALRMPEEAANLRRMKLRKNAKKEGYTPSTKALAFCDWSIFITNANKEMVPGEMIRTYYRIRWNVELIFKSWKGVLKIHQTNVIKNSNRFKCELYAKLILVVIIQKLYLCIHSFMWRRERRELSLDKFWKYIDSNKQKLHERIIEGCDRFCKFINSEMEYIQKICEKYHQNNRKSSLQMLDEMIGDSVPVKVKIELADEELVA